MSKTTQARSIPTRVAIAYAGTPEAPVKPIHATAYLREGRVVIATVRWAKGSEANNRVIEFKATDKVRWSPVVDETVVGARFCRTCPEPHPLRVGTDKYATLVCDVRARERGAANRAAKKAGTYVPARQKARVEAVARRDEMIDRILDIKPKSREQLIRALLGNIADAMGTDSKRFATVAAQYGMSVEEAVALVATR